jgi:hypothetical protein
MPSSSGPRNPAKSNLVFSIDTYDTSNCVTPLGCGGWNGSTQGVKNILDNSTLLYQNGLRVSNRQFYTAFGISYPESAYGGAAAGRNGLTPGYNVLSGGQTYGASRSLHLWVWDNNTNTWVPDSFFRGLRLGGHCYDNWAGAETGWQNELNFFNGDVAIIKQAFPNSTWIICGSHACQMFDTPTINNMVDLGAPLSTISSWTDGSAWREFVLVGKPGLGNGNAYGWAYENYPVNPAQVAHMNLSVTPRNLGFLSFDGTDDYVDTTGYTAHQSNQGTIETIARVDINSGDRYVMGIGGTTTFGASRAIRINSGTWSAVTYGSSTEDFNGIAPANTGTWYHVVFGWAGTAIYFYVNGVLFQATRSGLITPQGTTLRIGNPPWSTSSPWGGMISVVNHYNILLTSQQIQQNYRQYRTRFNLP